MENPLSALPVERLDDHLAAELVHKTQQLREAAAHERLRHELGEAQRIELLVGREDAFGPVQHDRPTAEREDLGRDHVLGVDGRIGPLEDEVDLLVEHHPARLAELEVAAALLAQGHGARVGGRAAVGGHEVGRGDVEDLVRAPLRLEHQREGRVSVDVDPLEGVHHEHEGAGARRHFSKPYYKPIR